MRIGATRLRFCLTIALAGAPPAPLLAAPSPQETAAVRANCAGDHQAFCPSAPPGSGADVSCLMRHAARLSSACQMTIGTPGASIAAPGPGPAVTSPDNRPPPDAALSPREATRVLTTSCNGDFERLCRGIRPGGGEAIACLKNHAPALTVGCKEALAPKPTPNYVPEKTKP
jgi:hypothetical protein